MERLLLESRLRGAIEREEFVLLSAAGRAG